MMIRTVAFSLLVALWLLPAGAAFAAESDDEEPEEHPVTVWSMDLGTEVDQADARSFFGTLGRDLTPKTTVYVSGDALDYPANFQNGYKSVGLEAGVTHDFLKQLHVGGALAHWQATDIVSVNDLKLLADWRAAPWSFGLRGGYRWSSFAALQTTATSTVSGDTLPAVASCKLKNLAAGAEGRYQGSVWGGYVSAMSYHYSEASCHLNLTDGTMQKERLAADAFATLAAPLVSQLAGVAVRHVGREETLLSSSISGGASWKHDDLVVKLEYWRQKEHFFGAASNTLAATGTADLGNATGVDCTLGLTRGGGVTSGAFVGFGVRARF